VVPALVLAAWPAEGREPRLSPCWLEGLREPVRCGSLAVPEDRSNPSSRRIQIHFAVVAAASTTAALDPLFVLAGGPGQAGTSYAPFVTSTFRKIRARRDIVLVDQRGTGKSNPLDCDSGDYDFSIASGSRRLSDTAKECLEKLKADVRFYSNFHAMEDLDAVRSALGYEKINLWGGSYGTRAALVYMRFHEDRVRVAILDGAAPFALRYPLHTAPDAQHALDQMFNRCEADEGCRSAFPRLRMELRDLLRRLGRASVRRKVRHPRTGNDQEVEISREAFVASLRGFLYVPEHTSLVPWVIHRATAGDFEPFVSLSLSLSDWSVESMKLGMTLSVLCSEDLPRIRQSEAARLAANTFLGTLMVDEWQSACSMWPIASLPPGYDAPLATKTPVLILSGAMDPVSPPHWGENVAASMPNSLHVVMRGAAHNVSPRGCVPDLMATFIAAGTARKLDATCVDRQQTPAFFVSPAGPKN
jgi:pimeloyl-ACP methyl ester carboxylesterase